MSHVRFNPSGGDLYFWIYHEAEVRGYRHSRFRSPYSKTTRIDDLNWGKLLHSSIGYNGATEALYEGDGYFVSVQGRRRGTSQDPTIDTFYVFSGDSEYTEQLFTQFNDQIKPAEVVDTDETGYTFWYRTSNGPQHKEKMIFTPPWATVNNNYPGELSTKINELVTLQPSMDKGRLLLWHGPPGTGKTSAIRSLSREWRHWADFLYITDPEVFFNDPQYFFHCVLNDSITRFNYKNSISHDDKWRVLIAEDSGEFLRAGASQRERQAASRLLNAADGLLGQGIRFLIIITTNERIDQIDEAVSRPGRCLTNLNFDRFSPEEASKWLNRPVSERMSLAELYNEKNLITNIKPSELSIGQYL